MTRLRRGVVPALVLAVVLVAGGLWWFQPWRLWTSSTVDEALPVARTVASPSAEPSTLAKPSPNPSPSTRVLGRGTFVDGEHGTSGMARIIELGDGRRFLRLEDLATSDGPDLHVWLSDRPAAGPWGSYDDGAHVRLGRLKATHGNQNYALPASRDITSMRSVVIWCDRFDVAFGSAPVRLS